MLLQKRFSIQSALSPDEARSRLLEAIGPARRTILSRDSRPFTGSMTGGSFRITRTSRGRNSFRPLIRGSIEPYDRGSRIQGTLRLHAVVLGFMAFLVLVPVWFLLNLIPAGVATGHWDRTILAVPGAMLFLLAMMGFGFVSESRRALRELAAIVDGDPTGA